jgi:hypothetical protein
MSLRQDLKYHSGRELTERSHAQTASDPAARRAHLAMAESHAALVKEIRQCLARRVSQAASKKISAFSRNDHRKEQAQKPLRYVDAHGTGSQRYNGEYQ